MNILQIISKNDRYGAQRLFLDQAAALRQLGHSVTIVTRGTKGHVTDAALAMGLPCHGIPLKGLSDLLFLRRLVKSGKIEMIHTFLDRADYFGIMTSRLTGVPVVSTMNVRRAHIGHRLADRVAIVSHKQRDLLLEKGVAAGKIRLVRPGIAVDRFAAPDPGKREQWKERLKSDQYGIVLCHIANMLPQKNHAASIALAAEMKKQGETPLLIIAGDPVAGAYYESLVKTIADAGLDKNVSFTGWTTELPELLSLSHFTLLPSVHEAFGIVLLEGMAAGTPVIATKGEGGAELIEEHGAGFLYEPGGDVSGLAKEMLSLWHDRDAYRSLSDRCRALVKNEYSLESLGRRLMQLYGSLEQD